MLVFLVIVPLPGVIIVCAIIFLEGGVGLGHVPGQVLDLGFYHDPAPVLFCQGKEPLERFFGKVLKQIFEISCRL